MMHEPVAHVGAWLKRVVEGYYRYHAVPGNRTRWADFENGSAAPGGMSFAAAVKGGSPIGNNFDRSLTGGFLVHALYMPIRRAF